MQVTFHWVRVQTFCYATEKRELLEETMTELLGTDEFQEEISEGEHGNIMTILETRLTKQREFNSLFKKLGPEICQWILDDIDNRIDEDCVFQKGRKLTLHGCVPVFVFEKNALGSRLFQFPHLAVNVLLALVGRASCVSVFHNLSSYWMALRALYCP